MNFVKSVLTTCGSESVLREVYKNSEAVILSQLNDFVSRGLIEIEQTGPILVQSADADTIECRIGVNLILKDKEYIERLEKENADFKALIRRMKEIE